MASDKFGDTKGPFTFWLFTILYLVALKVFSSPLIVTLPQDVTMPIILNLLIENVRTYGVILVFLIIFLALFEKRRSLKEIFSSVGLRRGGSLKSVLWSIATFPLLIVIGFISMTLTYPLMSAITPASNSGQLPLWYLGYILVQSFFPVAVVEEIFTRGYMLDRLMPQHPSSLVKALPAILLSSSLFTLYHLPSYLFSFSALRVVALLAGNIFPISVVISIAYVRAGTRNIIGPVFIHFLLDGVPIILRLIQ